MKEEIFRRRDIPKNKFKFILFSLILFLGVAAFMADYTSWYIFFLLVFFILYLIRIKRKYHRFRDYFFLKQVRRNLEQDFLDYGIYKSRNGNIVSFPRIIINPNQITIKYYSSIKFKKLIENNIESIGALLPEGWQIKDQYEITNGYKIVFKNGEEDRLFINSLDEYYHLIEKYGDGTIPLDKKISLDFNSDPHLLISAKTGAGKTYFIRSLILSLYLHNSPCRIILNDINQSNRDLYRVCELNGSESEILMNINEINDELKVRASNFDKIDKFERIVVILEEYLAFINTLDKKQRDQVEKILKIIAATGRKYKINLIIITQITSATEINTGIRSNATNLVLGRLDKSQKLSLSVDAPIQNFGDNIKGQANISRDGRFISFLTPTVDFKNILEEIEKEYENSI
jgi:hypothetical protein